MAVILERPSCDVIYPITLPILLPKTNRVVLFVVSILISKDMFIYTMSGLFITGVFWSFNRCIY